MLTTRIIIIITLLIEFRRHECQNPISDCTFQMNKYRSCLQQGFNKNTGKEKLTDREKIQFHDEIENCFLNEKCKSPFLPNKYKEAAESCFLTVKSDSRKELESCVKKETNSHDFLLPQDESDNLDNAQTAVALLNAGTNMNALCPFWSNKNRVGNCVRDKASVFQKKIQQNINLCKLREHCNSTITSACQSQWVHRSVPALCRCINNDNNALTLKYKQQYENCLKQKTVKLQTNDPIGKLLESYVRGWCPVKDIKNKNPCPPSKIQRMVATTTTKSPRAANGPPLKPLEKPAKIVKNYDNSDEQETTISEEITTPFEEITTTTEEAVTTPVGPEATILEALSTDPAFQNFLANNPALTFIANLVTGKTDLSSFFNGANLLGSFQGGFGNVFGNVGQT